MSFGYSGAAGSLFTNVTLEINKGECVGLIGPSGSGKTTLAKIIAGFIIPFSGKILLEGKNITGKPSREVFLVSQESDLFPWQKVKRQVAFATQDHQSEKVIEILEMVRLRGFDEFYPDQLSGGMKKRLLLARALAVNPKLLILDETFNSLDHLLKKEIIEDLSIVLIKEKITTIVITHDLDDLKQIASRVINLCELK
jgi:ABC-type nitrate/sulfonate/bicarbonate transport system ATPase subunit